MRYMLPIMIKNNEDTYKHYFIQQFYNYPFKTCAWRSMMCKDCLLTGKMHYTVVANSIQNFYIYYITFIYIIIQFRQTDILRSCYQSPNTYVGTTHMKTVSWIDTTIVYGWLREWVGTWHENIKIILVNKFRECLK